MIEIKRREGESVNAFLFRFSKRMKQSGILLESKKRRYQKRAVSKSKRKASAIYRDQKKREYQEIKKKGF
ncbi:30S ribosomal protein S21 [Candidatus Wolfebacteria bacterium]|nr:30S ribosomal protein S21 [Candidatus Wolfebacteria bacterium]